MATPDLIAVILAGGISQRMGKDKSELLYHGKPQRVYLKELLLTICSRVFISCNADQSKRLSDEPVIEDAYPESGPLGGILSAFHAHPDKAILTVPCDLPFLDSETLTTLVTGRNPAKMATTCWNIEADALEPLVTIWEPAAAVLLRYHFNRGYRSPYRILSQGDTQLVRYYSGVVFKNANSPTEYQDAARIIKNLQDDKKRDNN